jgi:hypothetical protein
MPITSKQKKVILAVDKKVKQLIANGATHEKILVQMIEHMPTIKTIISSTDREELDFYCQEFTGFYSYMKILEHLARGIKEGRIT